jgi:hypothetical protein
MLTLMNECSVSEAWDPNGSAPKPLFRPFKALWDTGATRSMISQNVVDACGLISTGFEDTHHAQGTTKDVPVFLVNIQLPTDVQVIGVPALRGKFIGFDVLIGMDIITKGDFAVTNRKGRTKFTFRIPSQADIDFYAEDQRAAVIRSKKGRGQRNRRK